MSSVEITTEVIIDDHVEDSSGSYVLDEYEYNNINSVQDENCQNITCAGTTLSTIYLQDGQYFISADNQAIVLESSNEDGDQYVLNDEVNMMQLDVNDPQVLEDVGMVRYYDEESGQIYYCKTINEGDSNYVAVASENGGIVLADNEIVINNDQSQSTISADGDDIVNESMIQLHPENVELITSEDDQTKYSYAILKDGKLHLRTMEQPSTDDQFRIEQDDRIAAQLEALQKSISFDNAELACDLGSITGKNLITGQVVTLDSYLERLEKRKSTIQEELLRSPVRRQSYNYYNRNEDNVKHKRISDGNNLANGKKLKGKIVKIEKKQELRNEQNASNNNNNNNKQRKMEENENSNRVKSLLVLKDAKEKVSSTLAGLMELDSIHSQLNDKNIVIKLTEKTYDRSKTRYDKAIAYFYGKMTLNENKGKQWEFILINNKATEVNWMSNAVSNDSEPLKEEDVCQETIITVCVYLLMTTDKNGKKTTRVNIETVPPSHCPFCNNTIDTNMERHLNQVHVPETTFGFACSQCKLNFDCMTRLEKHLKTHSKNYRFECGTCSKKFTRHTNWQRHMDIHKSASEVAFHCDICGCGFNYASSLTRHIVQKHINKR